MKKYGKWALIGVLTLATAGLLCLFIGAFTISAEAPDSDSGNIGGFTWKLESGVLTISGKGEMVGQYDSYDALHDRVSDKVEKLVIEEGVTRIADFAFRYYPSLSEIQMADSVQSIGCRAFEECKALSKIEFSKNLVEVGEGAFYDCLNLSEAVLPNGVRRICVGAFQDCGLRALTLPAGIRAIGEGAFWGCDDLDTVSYDGTVESFRKIALGTKNDPLLKALPFTPPEQSLSYNIESGVLHVTGYGPCDSTDFPRSESAALASVTEIIFDEGITDVGWALNLPLLKKVTFPSTLATIGGFSDCPALESVNIPENCTLLYHYGLFMNCTSLTDLRYDAVNVTIGDAWMGAHGDATGWMPFADAGKNASLTVTFGKNVERIPGSLFNADYIVDWTDSDTPVYIQAPTYVQKVIFEGDALKEIGRGAFGNCPALKSAVYPGSKAQFSKVTVGEGNDALLANLRFASSTGLSGDANDDGKINASDRIYLARAIAGWNGYFAAAETCDLNGDGKVNTSDRVYLARVIAGWEGYSL